MISFFQPYSFRQMLAQGAAPVGTPAPVASPAPTPAPSLPFGTVKMMGAEVPLLELGVAAAAIAGAIWVMTEGFAVVDGI